MPRQAPCVRPVQRPEASGSPPLRSSPQILDKPRLTFPCLPLRPARQSGHLKSARQAADAILYVVIFLQQANWRRAIWDFFNSIDPTKTSIEGVLGCTTVLAQMYHCINDLKNQLEHGADFSRRASNI